MTNTTLKYITTLVSNFNIILFNRIYKEDDKNGKESEPSLTKEQLAYANLKFCPKCEFVLERGFLTCPYCGAQLS